MLKLIPNELLAMNLFKVTERIKDGCGYSREYLLHEDVLYILGEPHSISLNLYERKISKCKPRKDIDADFTDAVKLKPGSVPSALINMTAHAFNLWLGFIPYLDQGVFIELNREANKHLSPYHISIKLNEHSLHISHRGKRVTYEEALRTMVNAN